MFNNYDGPQKKNAIEHMHNETIIIARLSSHLGKMSMTKLPGIDAKGRIMKK